MYEFLVGVKEATEIKLKGGPGGGPHEGAGALNSRPAALQRNAKRFNRPATPAPKRQVPLRFRVKK